MWLIKSWKTARKQKVTKVTQTTNRFFDEFARILTGAAGAADGARREVETFFRAQSERILAEMDVVKREDFEVVREMAQKAREENERLAARIAELERKFATRDAEQTDGDP